MKDNLKWIIIFAVLCIVSATVWIVMNNVGGDHKNAVIRQNGKIIKEIDLNAVKDPYEFERKTSDGQHSNTIRVEQGKIAIIDADCADKICVNTGYISNSVIPIVCLPHRLSITIVDKESDFDAIAGNK